jgi:hypothetical protein
VLQYSVVVDACFFYVHGFCSYLYRCHYPLERKKTWTRLLRHPVSQLFAISVWRDSSSRGGKIGHLGVVRPLWQDSELYAGGGNGMVIDREPHRAWALLCVTKSCLIFQQSGSEKMTEDKCWFCQSSARMARSHVMLHCGNAKLRAARTESWDGKDP